MQLFQSNFLTEEESSDYTAEASAALFRDFEINVRTLDFETKHRDAAIPLLND